MIAETLAQPITHVRQEGSHGCGPACLAMVTGRSYRDVCDWFRVTAWQNARHDGRELTGADRDAIEPHDFLHHGITHWEVERYLAEHGYATALRWREIRAGEPRPTWPPPPFAPVHLASVTTVSGNHFVVWLPDGRVLDPATGVTTLADPRFVGLTYVLGVCRMAGLA